MFSHKLWFHNLLKMASPRIRTSASGAMTLIFILLSVITCTCFLIKVCCNSAMMKHSIELWNKRNWLILIGYCKMPYRQYFSLITAEEKLEVVGCSVIHIFYRYVNVKYNEGEHVLFHLNRTQILPNLLRKNILPISEFWRYSCLACLIERKRLHCK